METLSRGSPALASYTKRWNLSVYFTLRFQDIAVTLEGDMNGDGLVQAASDAPGNQAGGFGGGGAGGKNKTKSADVKFLLASTAGSWAALNKCWAEDIFTAQIADRFVRLSAQILSRYGGWLAEGVDALGTGARRGSDDDAASGAGAAGASPGGLNGGGGGGGGEGGGPPPLDGGGAGKAKGGDGGGGGEKKSGVGEDGGGGDGRKKKDGAGGGGGGGMGPTASWGATAGGDELLMVRADVELFVTRVVGTRPHSHPTVIWSIAPFIGPFIGPSVHSLVHSHPAVIKPQPPQPSLVACFKGASHKPTSDRTDRARVHTTV